ncbi:hypothetical protein CH378_11875 [Leptospira kmetyi]|uniref:Uncharacterized protein n=1 Tax=Leptospira kmetyi TaxID=408139 RepID=A0ABX4N8C8_9LEPT|nr:hypothetical protein CH378_11875 [Leptospira kmetyi]
MCVFTPFGYSGFGNVFTKLAELELCAIPAALSSEGFGLVEKMGALRVSFICNDRLEMVQDARGNGRLTDASRSARNRAAILAPGFTTSLRSTKLNSRREEF